MNKERYEHLTKHIDLLEIDVERGEIKNKNIRVTRAGNKTNSSPRLCLSLKGKRYFVHEIIAVAAGLNPVNKTINHKDGNTLNNAISNLEVMTNKENYHHARKHNLINIEGSGNGRAKLTKNDVIKIKQMLSMKEHTQTEIAKIFGVDISIISKIKSGKLWKHVI